MKNNIFNPNDWSSEEEKTNYPSPYPGDNNARVEQTILELEQKGLDITNGYTRWLDCGFALAAEFNEAGRDYFHRISKMNPAYDPKECDRQFDHCLKSKGSGISIATFFFYSREAGISVKITNDRKGKVSDRENKFVEQLENLEASGEEISEKDASLLPDDIFHNLPPFLKKLTDTADTPEERDVLLIGGITVLSACLGNFFGFYLKKMVFPNLYFFLSAQASAGKGSLNDCRRLVYPIHYQLRQEAQAEKKLYDQNLAVYNASKDNTAEKPVEPKRKMLFLPANSSSTGIFQLINDNDGRGLLFETEADTISNVLSTEYGNYSDGFRKAFHHEMISYYRKTNDEHVEIHRPQLSTVLSGTPNQVVNLIKNSENGLFSSSSTII